MFFVCLTPINVGLTLSILSLDRDEEESNVPPKKKKKKSEKQKKKKKKHKKKSGKYSDCSESDSDTIYPSDLKKEQEADRYTHTNKFMSHNL